MESYKVKDISLADRGGLMIEWAAMNMPVLRQVSERFSREKPLKGFTVGACLHVTKETGVLAKTLKAGGAEVYVCGSNPLSTQDDVAAALVKEGVGVYAWRNQTTEDYYWCIDSVLDHRPMITLDDVADFTGRFHIMKTEALSTVI